MSASGGAMSTADQAAGATASRGDGGGDGAPPKGKPPTTERTPLIEKKNAAHLSALERLKAADERARGGILDQWFMQRDDPDFADHLQLALRAGAAIAILKTHELYGDSIHGGSHQAGHAAAASSAQLLSAGAIVICFVTLYRSLGETLHNVWDALRGVLVGSAYAGIMFAVFPDGASVDHSSHSPSWVFGNMMGLAFVFCTLMLNFNIVFKVFTNLTFVAHWMLFLKPEGDAGSKYIEFRTSIATGIWNAFSGCALAVFICMFPYPLTATAKAERTARTLVQAMAKTWSVSITFLSKKSEDLYLKGDLELHYQLTWRAMHVLDGHLANMWPWESVGRHSMHRMRLMLGRFEGIIRESADHLTDISSLRYDGEMTDLQLAVRTKVKPFLHDVSDRASLLLAELVQLACEGRLPEGQSDVEALQSERVRLQEEAQQLRRSIAALRKEFHKAKKEAGAPVLSEMFLDAGVLSSAVECYAQITMEFAEYVTNPNFDEDAPKPRPLAVLAKKFAAIFDTGTIFNPELLLFATRNALQIICCFYLGYTGYANLIPAYSVGAAVTASILLSMHHGSAVQTSLTRVQGVALGLFTGQLAYAQVGCCTLWAGVVRQLLSVFGFGIALFLYFDSGRYALLGKFSAVFLSRYLVRECSDATIRQKGSITSIEEAVMCIFVMGIISILLTGAAPSKMVHGDLVSIWRSIGKKASEVYSLSPPAMEDLLQLQQRIYAVRDLSEHATSEFRWGRKPWRHDILSQATRCTFRVRTLLSAMARNINRGGGGTAAALADFMSLPEFRDLKAMTTEGIASFPRILDVLVEDDSRTWTEVRKPELIRDPLKLNIISEKVSLAVTAANTAIMQRSKDDQRSVNEGDVDDLSSAIYSMASVCRCMCYFKMYVFANYH